VDVASPYLVKISDHRQAGEVIANGGRSSECFTSMADVNHASQLDSVTGEQQQQSYIGHDCQLTLKLPGTPSCSWLQGLLRNTVMDASCIQIKPREGKLRGREFGIPHHTT